MIKTLLLESGMELHVKVSEIKGMTSPGFLKETEIEQEEPVKDEEGKPTGEFKTVKRKNSIPVGTLGCFTVYIGVFGYPIAADPDQNVYCGYEELLYEWKACN